MALLNHHYFLPGLLDPGFKSRTSEEPFLLHHILHANVIKPLPEILCSKPITFLDKWRFHQLQRFLRSFPHPLRGLQDLNSIEEIFYPKDPPLHAISLFYKALTDFPNSPYPHFLAKWEIDLDSPITNTQKDKVLKLAHVSSPASKIAEVNYKLLTRWHYTPPAKLHQMFPDSSPLCWRSCGNKATHAHIWWCCPLIRPFWTEVLNLISKISDVNLPNDPWTVLIHSTKESIVSYKRSLIPHLLNTAKALIPTFWGQSTIPSIKSWLQKVAEVHHLEDITYSIRATSQRHSLTWAPWIKFISSPFYKDILTQPE